MLSNPYTTVMATTGETFNTYEDIRKGVEAGARWFRLSLGYRYRPNLDHAKYIRKIQRETGYDLKIIVDLPSSRPRTGEMNETHIQIGEQIIFEDTPAASQIDNDLTGIPLPGLSELLPNILVGHRIWFLDGRIEFEVESITQIGLVARLIKGDRPIKTRNAIFLPDSDVSYRMVVQDDMDDLRKFKRSGIVPDWFALSFISSPDDAYSSKKQLSTIFGDEVNLMAKIETKFAVDRFDAILDAVDSIMVARGDLALAVPYSIIPKLQERFVRKCLAHNKPVVVATQMLETFADTGLPQRCELTDVALAVRQRASAVMLSRETVYSARPIESIKLAHEIISVEEKSRIEVDQYGFISRAEKFNQEPMVVAIEGTNGVGKSTLCNSLNKRDGIPIALSVSEGWNSSNLKRKVILDSDWMTAALYFLSGVIEGSRELKKSKDKLVVTDRSVWSTLAVHYYSIGPETLSPLLDILHHIGDKIKFPDLVIVLQASFDTCQSRIASKDHKARELDMITAAEKYFKREVQFYQWLNESVPNVFLVDTEGKSETEVYSLVSSIIKEKRKSFQLL